jgi:NAD(P)-dependent dehydrogenase (short-subunit alcohol dehydrogenase family)
MVRKPTLLQAKPSQTAEGKHMTEKESDARQTAALENQVAVVTGAARGIGAEVARSLAALGARVVLTTRNDAQLTQVKQEISERGGYAEVSPCDLTDQAAVSRLGEHVAQRHGRCDILVNNAAIGLIGKPLVELTPAEWDQIMNTNLRGPYLMIRAIAPLMIAARSGHIINISSLAGKNPLPKGAAYAASKWGLNGLTYSVAEELRQHRVRVTAIAPGSVNTHFSASPGKDVSKMLQPSDVAHVVISLVTQSANSFISEVLLRPTEKP